MTTFPYSMKDLAWARWNIDQSTEVPAAQAKVSLAWTFFQKSMKDKWPSPKSDDGLALAELVKERNYWEAQLVDADYKNSHIRDLQAQISQYVIEPDPDEVESKRQAYETAVAHLQKLMKRPS